MHSLLYRFQNWMRSVIQVKYHCIVYYKNEKICSCKNYTQAEQHIRKMFDSVSHDDENNTEEKNCWNRFRKSFKIANE